MKAAPEQIVAEARRKGPVPPSTYRVVVRESNSTLVAGRDFDARADAIAYADDVASESDWPVPQAWVFDETFSVVHQGTHYVG